MKKIVIGSLNLWQFEQLRSEAAIKHFVTDRASSETTKEFTLSYSSSPVKEGITENRNILANALGIESSRLYFPVQVHKTRIVEVDAETSLESLAETDALITHKKNICIAVMSADCVPILLYDKKNGAVAAVHSGWRGTVAKILEKTLFEMQLKFGSTGKDILACIGPSVCQASYEVGKEVIDEVHNAFGNVEGLMIPQAMNKAKLDLWKANKLQLTAFGVKESQIEVSDLCTVINNQHFFSARKGDTGRFAAGIMLV
jgi:YfiH family protein